MANEIQSTDLLGAELLCGYKYFDAQNELTQNRDAEIATLNQLFQQKEKIENSFDKKADLTQLAEVRTSYDEYKNHYKGKDYSQYCGKKVKSLIEEKIEFQSEFRLFLIFTILLAILTATFVIGFIFSQTDLLPEDERDKFIPMLPFSIIGMCIIQVIACTKRVFWIEQYNEFDGDGECAGMCTVLFLIGILAFPISLLVYLYKTIVRAVQISEVNKRIVTRNFWAQYQREIPMMTIKQYVDSMSDTVKNVYFKHCDREKIAKNVAIINQQIQAQQLVIQSIEKQIVALTNEGKQIVNDLTEIPAYYFKEDSVIQMLFFYVNKRANNITDLINMYEQKVFQDKLIHAVQSIKVSIDNLANVVRSSFVTLGLQLGVINESIQENTRQLLLNKDKLAQIQDDLSRNYIQTVEHINNVENIVNNQNEYITNVTNEQHNSVVANITIKPN